MTEDEKPKPLTLAGEAALDLWRQGRDVWNSWIEQHPSTDISFAFVDFSPERDSEGSLSFSGYRFGNGDVSFRSVNFGNGYVDFRDVIFGQGNTDFTLCRFGNGDVDFCRATFGKGDIEFSGVTFGKGTIDFYRTTFGGSYLSFFNANFGDGNLDFFGADMGTCSVNLIKTTFGSGQIILANAEVRSLIFSPVSIRSLEISSIGLSASGLVKFEFRHSPDTLKSISLQGASFKGCLQLSGNLKIVPDLVGTLSSHQVELTALNVTLRRTWHKLCWPLKLSSVAEDPNDAARLRRLKEIAETNKDHQAALRFSADENRARRWIETSWLGSVLDMAFSACSNYGQSILRPFLGLFLLAVVSISLYKKLAVTTDVEWWAGPGWGQSLLLSISNSLPFLPQSRDLRTDALTALYSGGPGFWVDALMIGQGVFSFVFLFLIGLGLRNRFRL